MPFLAQRPGTSPSSRHSGFLESSLSSPDPELLIPKLDEALGALLAALGLELALAG